MTVTHGFGSIRGIFGLYHRSKCYPYKNWFNLDSIQALLELHLGKGITKICYIWEPSFSHFFNWRSTHALSFSYIILSHINCAKCWKRLQFAICQIYHLLKTKAEANNLYERNFNSIVISPLDCYVCFSKFNFVSHSLATSERDLLFLQKGTWTQQHIHSHAII